MSNVKLRRAIAEDSDFAFAVKKAAFRKYVEKSWGWDEDTQRQIHERRFETQDFRIITWGNVDVGMIAMAIEPECMRVNQLFILPEYQSIGIGSDVLHGIFYEAAELGMPVRLQVRKDNPRAVSFYKRNGFAQYDSTETHFLMEKGSK